MWGRNVRELPPKKAISIQDLRRIMLRFPQNLNKISVGSSQDLFHYNEKYDLTKSSKS